MKELKKKGILTLWTHSNHLSRQNHRAPPGPDYLHTAKVLEVLAASEQGHMSHQIKGQKARPLIFNCDDLNNKLISLTTKAVC